MSSLLKIARPLPWLALCLLSLLLSFMKDTYLLKLGTSLLAPPPVPIKTGIGILDEHVDELLDTAVSSTNALLGLHTFHRAHIMGHCSGQLALAKETSATCTYTYDVVASLRAALDPGVPIPGADGAVGVLSVLFKTIFALYFVGTLCVVCGVCFSLTPSREHGGTKVLLDAIAFMTLLMASTIGTAFAMKLHEVITATLGRVGVTASYSSLYVLLTWTAVTVMLAATVIRLVGRYRSAGTIRPVGGVPVPRRSAPVGQVLYDEPLDGRGGVYGRPGQGGREAYGVVRDDGREK